MQHIKEIVKKQISKVINENIRIINEKWSYSDVVDDNAVSLMRFINQNLNNGERELLCDGVSFCIMENIQYNIFGRDIILNCYVYECANMGVYKFVYDNCEQMNGFQEEENILTLTLYKIGVKWADDVCEQNISHELMHVLQICYGVKNNPKYKSLVDTAYNKANEILRSDYGYSSIDKLVAKTMYYCNSHEQDAFIQEYGKALKSHPSLLVTKRSEIYDILAELSKNIEYITEHISDNTVINAIKMYQLYGYNIKNFQLMMNKQFKRFQKKIANVEKNILNKYKRIKPYNR